MKLKKIKLLNYNVFASANLTPARVALSKLVLVKNPQLKWLGVFFFLLTYVLFLPNLAFAENQTLSHQDISSAATVQSAETQQADASPTGALHGPLHSLESLERLLTIAKEKNLSQSVKWRRLLLIPDRWYPSDTSLVDDPKFFLAENGKYSPESELKATLKAMLYGNILRENKPAHCLYPARYRFLDRQLNLKKYGVDINTCPKLQKFLNFAQYDSVSLVFSNYFIGSPGSMFGHTLLRLHRKNKVKRSDLLDDSINFSAFVPHFNALLYPFQGLFGFFKGRYAMLPYYRKIQEYNNEESRDVWEYQLNLTQDEIDDLVAIMVEVGEVSIDYYYLDDNCSYILLTMLEAMNPKFQFSRQYTMYTIPGDTLRTVYRTPGLVTKIKYRPSSLTRYLYNYELLNKKEQKIFDLFLKNKTLKNIPALEDSLCDEACKVKLFDTALEYIDYDEKLIGLKQAVKYKDLRHEILSERARIPLKPFPIKTEPFSSPPHLGHNSNMVGGYLGQNQEHKSFFDFQWQPAMHDISSNKLGYNNEMQIKFLNMHIRASEHKVQLKSLELLDLTSLPKSYPHVKTSAWALNLGYKESPICDKNVEYCKSTHLNFGKGFSYHLLNEKLLIYEFLQGDLLFSNLNNHRANFSPMATLGFSSDILSSVNISAQANYRVPFIKDLKTDLFIHVELTKYLSESHELKFFYEFTNGYSEYLLGYRSFL